MAWVLRSELFPDAPEVPYPPHMEAGTLLSHWRKGVRTPGRHLVCKVCNLQNNTRSRNGDARFIRKHRRCGLSR